VQNEHFLFAMSDFAIDRIKTPMVPAWRAVDALHLGRDGASDARRSNVAEEVPVAFRYNGFSHAVMMATPEDLLDFAAGFSLSEGVIACAGDMVDVQTHASDDGIAIDIALGADAFRRYLAGRRVRSLRGHTSCGLCGAEDLRDIRRPAAQVAKGKAVSVGEVQSALEALRGFQPLSRRTRGAHASAWVAPDGTIRAVREDVGRHNALDKLIGAGLRGAFSSTEGFCLITSRCSFEMVQKAVMAGYPTLVSAAAPTALAIRTATAAGLTLLSIARGDGHFVYSAPDFEQETWPVAAE
jgi:FdhD protein